MKKNVAAMEITREEVEQFLFHEANLLDSGHYEKWLELFASGGIYWIPIDENSDPEIEPSIIYDDAEERKMRVHQIVSPRPHYAQIPRSLTTHMLSNIVLNELNTGEMAVSCNMVVYEIREGNERQLGLATQRAFAGRCEYRLTRNAAGGISIGRKKIVLINRYTSIENFSFIL